ncbi:MAG: hypothetical protein RLZZ241_1880 [Bacteroidota bacterium]|jgi:SOS-response transcriptional repressor LexA
MDLDISIKKFTDIRRDLGFTQAEFAEKLGIPQTTADIERGRTKLSGKVVVELLKQFRINPLWLFGDSNHKYLETSNVPVLPKVITVDNADKENIVLVNAKAAAGYPQNIQDTSWYRQLPAFDLPIPQFRNATYRGFQVEGESMLPSLRSGDWVLGKAVDSWQEVSPNRIYVVVLQDAVMVKKIEKLPGTGLFRLISLNDSYQPYEVSEQQLQEVWEVSSKLTFGIETNSDSNLLKQLQESMDELKMRLSKA